MVFTKKETVSQNFLIVTVFLCVDQSPEGEVVVICNQSMKDEAEALLSHFGIYLEVVFGSVVWKAFTNPYQTTMEEFQYCPLENCAVERFLNDCI